MILSYQFFLLFTNPGQLAINNTQLANIKTPSQKSPQNICLKVYTHSIHWCLHGPTYTQWRHAENSAKFAGNLFYFLF